MPVQTADRFVEAVGAAGIEDVSYYRLAYVDHCPHSLVRVDGLQEAVEEFFDRTLLNPDKAHDVIRRTVAPEGSGCPDEQ